MPATASIPPTRILTGRDVRALLDLGDCIDAVERAFARHHDGHSLGTGVVGLHVPGGGFHVKAAGLDDGSPRFVAKVNANFPGNRTRGLPTIQGMAVLFDAADGRVLAAMDSMELTARRTAAATAVAARHLARAEATVVTICGCGEQGRMQLLALTRVRPITHAWAFDADPDAAARFAREMSVAAGIPVHVARDLGDATRASDIVVTCTTASRWFLDRAQVRPGAFVAGVGADAPDKQELSPALLAASAVVVDVLDQCAAFGDLHHALVAGAMVAGDVRGDLAQVVAGACARRESPEEVIVFDSTGTALEDVAAASLVHERALAAGVGTPVSLGAA